MHKISESIVERLRKSKQISDEAFFAEGKQHGRMWAENHAETVQLERLEQSHDPWSGWQFSGGGSAAAEKFYFIIEPASRDYGAARDFWLHHFDEAVPEPAYIDGFAEGAMEVWTEAKDQVAAG
jgi:hypothetical protein